MQLPTNTMHLPAMLGLSAVIGLVAGTLTETPTTTFTQDAEPDTLVAADDATLKIVVDEESEGKAEEKSELEQMREEISRLQTEYQLMSQRQKNAMLEMELEKQALSAETSLRSVRQQEELADMKSTIESPKRAGGLSGSPVIAK